MAWIYFCLLALMSSAIFYVIIGSQLSGANKRSQLILLITAIAVPMISLVIYQQRGAYDEVALVESMATLNEKVNAADSAFSSMAPMQEFQHQLEAITEAKPDKAEYWFLLGGLHKEMQDFDGAVNAYEEASRLFPNDTSIHARLAEAQFLADNYMLTEAVRVHIDPVLDENPFDTTVLGILGISAYRAGQFETAIRFWEKSLQALPPMSGDSQSIRASIEQAKVAGGLGSLEAQDSSNDAASLSIDLDVSIDESIKASPGTDIFVFARQFKGPPMPVVVERIRVGQLPMRIRLDDSKMMIQGRKLADFPQLELVARLSFSGQPMARKGDYEIIVGPVNPAEIESVIALKIIDMVTEQVRHN